MSCLNRLLVSSSAFSAFPKVTDYNLQQWTAAIPRKLAAPLILT